MLTYSNALPHHFIQLQQQFTIPYRDEYVTAFLEDDSVICRVALDGDVVVGFIYGYILKRIDTLPMLYIHRIDVKEEYQGQGIGTKLIKEMIQYKNRNMVSKIFVITNKSNQKAINLYQKTGGIAHHNDDILFEYK